MRQTLLGSISGLGYWKQTEHPDNGRKLRLLLVDLFAWALRPRTHKPQYLSLFLQKTDFRREVLDGAVLSKFRGVVVLAVADPAAGERPDLSVVYFPGPRGPLPVAVKADDEYNPS